MENSGRFQLIIRRGPRPGEVSSLSKPTMIIGRDGRNDLVVTDPEISRQHSQFDLQADGYVIKDLGSTNGTFVNGQRITGPHLLSDGDEIGLGETVTLVYQAFAEEIMETVMAPHATVEPIPEPAAIDPFSGPVMDDPFSEPAPADLFPDPAAPDVPPPPFGADPFSEPAAADVPPPPFAVSSPSEPAPSPEPTPAPAFTLQQLPPPPAYSPTPSPAPPPLRESAPPPMPLPSREPTRATPMAPPSYTPPAEEEDKPKSRKGLYIGCGCLVLLALCILVVVLGWNYGDLLIDWVDDMIQSAAGMMAPSTLL